ncbi:MAG: DUF881 domain-containing protein [Aeromicrobium sp.]
MPDKNWRSLLRPASSQIVMALLLAGLAFAMTIQFRHKDTGDYSGVRGGELIELLRSLDAANERISTQVSELTVTRNDLLSSTKKSAEAERQARKRADDLNILAGSVAASGPGATLTIADPDGRIDAAALLNAVSELRDAGAEAVAINGTARVVAQTYFLDDEDGVRVGGRAVKSPFVIEAIGDPSTMAEAVTFRGGLADKVQNRGGSLNVTTSDKITITALADVKRPEYAQPSS